MISRHRAVPLSLSPLALITSRKTEMFSQNRKLSRPDRENLLMKFLQLKRIPLQSLHLLAQVLEIEVSKVIFHIVDRIFENCLVNLSDNLFICDTEIQQIMLDILKRPAVVMRTKINQGVQAKIDGTIQPEKACQIGIFFGVRVGIRLYIGGPALDVTAEVRKIAA